MHPPICIRILWLLLQRAVSKFQLNEATKNANNMFTLVVETERRQAFSARRLTAMFSFSEHKTKRQRDCKSVIDGTTYVLEQKEIAKPEKTTSKAYRKL